MGVDQTGEPEGEASKLLDQTGDSSAPGARGSVLGQRLRQGQSDLDDAIALLRSLPLADLPPAIVFDPQWGDGSR